MFIKYNDTNIHAIPDIRTKSVRMKNKKTGKVVMREKIDSNQTPQDIKWLRPGWNEFPSALWLKTKNHPTHLKMIEDKKIEFLSEKVKVKQGKKMVTKVIGEDDEEVSLELIAEKRSIEIIKGTFNRDILQRWADEEIRHKVKRAVMDQIELVNNAGKKKES